mgnify:CR=1 FL=1
MKNSIEKDIEIINNFIAYFNKNIQNGYKADLTVLGEEIEALEHILSDYKKVVKENEELKQDRKNNYQMIALSQQGALRYMQGYEDGKKLRRSAVASIVENQQYYIVRKQMEKYEEHIKKLQKENEELKNQEATQRKINELLVQRYSNSIPIQKVKDIIDRIDYDIKKTKEIISKNTNIYASYRKNDYQIVRLKAMNTKSLDIKKRLQKLLESKK